MSRYFLQVLIALALTLLLSACAGLRDTTTPPAAEPWQARQQTLEELQQWDLSARISVSRGDDGWHGSLRWRQRTNTYAIDLVGPLGQGRIDIDGTPSMVRLRTDDGRELRAADVETLLADATGLGLPISGLFYWIRGLPEANMPAQLMGDEQGLLTGLQQNGWNIVFSDYQLIDALQLPTRITAQQEDLQVKLAIQTWKLST